MRATGTKGQADGPGRPPLSCRSDDTNRGLGGGGGGGKRGVSRTSGKFNLLRMWWEPEAGSKAELTVP